MKQEMLLISKRRASFEIKLDILRVLDRKECIITAVIRRVGTTHTRINCLLEELIVKGLISCCFKPTSVFCRELKVYSITTKGKQLLFGYNKYSEMKDLL